MAGGHTQRRTSCPSEPNAMRASPPSPMKPAGAHAQRCGWWVKRTDSPASIAQPKAKPQSTPPVSSFGSVGMNGIAARTPAARSPLASEPMTIRPRCPFGCCEGDCFVRVRRGSPEASWREVPSWVAADEAGRPASSSVDGEAAISNTLPSRLGRASGVPGRQLAFRFSWRPCLRLSWRCPLLPVPGMCRGLGSGRCGHRSW